MIGLSMKEKGEGFVFLFYFEDLFIKFGFAGCSLLWAFSRGSAHASHWRGFCRQALGSGTQASGGAAPWPEGTGSTACGFSFTDLMDVSLSKLWEIVRASPIA